MSEEKKRGRKQGSKIGPRTVYFVVIGNKGSEEVPSPVGANESQLLEFTAEKVQKDCELAGWTVNKVYGPYHQVKGLLKPSQKKEQSAIKDDVDFAECLGKAEVDGWEGSIFAVKGKSDIVCFLPLKNLSGGKGTKTMDYVSIDKVKMLDDSEDLPDDPEDNCDVEETD